MDIFGRVIITDVSNGSIIRMWKGYRGAQVAWLNAPERWEKQVQRSTQWLKYLKS